MSYVENAIEWWNNADRETRLAVGVPTAGALAAVAVFRVLPAVEAQIAQPEPLKPKCTTQLTQSSVWELSKDIVGPGGNPSNAEQEMQLTEGNPDIGDMQPGDWINMAKPLCRLAVEHDVKIYSIK